MFKGGRLAGWLAALFSLGFNGSLKVFNGGQLAGLFLGLSLTFNGGSLADWLADCFKVFNGDWLTGWLAACFSLSFQWLF